MFEDTVKIFVHPLFTASCSHMNSPLNQTNHFLVVSFLILLRSLRAQLILLNNPRDEVEGIIQQY